MSPNRLAVVTTTLLAAFAGSPSAAEGVIEQAHQFCQGATSNADFGNCSHARVSALIEGMSDFECDDTHCRVLMACEEGGPPNRCETAGFMLQQVPGPSGSNWIITEPNGAQSLYHSCGTCQEIEHSAGSLIGADLQRLDSDRLLLEFPLNEGPAAIDPSQVPPAFIIPPSPFGSAGGVGPDPIEVVAQVYQGYIDGTDPGIYDSPFLSSDLAQMVEQAWLDPRDPIGNYGVDPVIQGQDFDIETIVVKELERSPDYSVVVVQFDNFGRSSEVHFVLRPEAEAWRIDDLYWFGSEGQITLRSILQSSESNLYSQGAWSTGTRPGSDGEPDYCLAQTSLGERTLEVAVYSWDWPALWIRDPSWSFAEDEGSGGQVSLTIDALPAWRLTAGTTENAIIVDLSSDVLDVTGLIEDLSSGMQVSVASGEHSYGLFSLEGSRGAFAALRSCARSIGAPADF